MQKDSEFGVGFLRLCRSVRFSLVHCARLPQVQELVAFGALQPTRRAESWARIAFSLESQPSIPLDGASHRAKHCKLREHSKSCSPDVRLARFGLCEVIVLSSAKSFASAGLGLQGSILGWRIGLSSQPCPD